MPLVSWSTDFIHAAYLISQYESWNEFLQFQHGDMPPKADAPTSAELDDERLAGVARKIDTITVVVCYLTVMMEASRFDLSSFETIHLSGFQIAASSPNVGRC